MRLLHGLSTPEDLDSRVRSGKLLDWLMFAGNDRIEEKSPDGNLRQRSRKCVGVVGDQTGRCLLQCRGNNVGDHFLAR
jgi:hypothetical protein